MLVYAGVMNKSYPILIKNLKEQIRIKGWSQDTLAEKSDVYQERISNLLNGKTPPTLALIDKIADALGITTVELLTDKVTPVIIKEEKASFKTIKNKVIFTKYGKNGKVKNVVIHIPNLNKFREDFIAFNVDKDKPKSGKPSSYANYIEYILQNYYDNFGEVLDLYSTETIDKLELLRNSPNFKDYNITEKRFPNAAIEAYIRFIKQY